MPEDHELYYGFTRFAVELNEVDQDQVHQYAPTDSRFRSDQRYGRRSSLIGAEGKVIDVIMAGGRLTEYGGGIERG